MANGGLDGAGDVDAVPGAADVNVVAGLSVAVVALVVGGATWLGHRPDLVVGIRRRAARVGPLHRLVAEARRWSGPRWLARRLAVEEVVLLVLVGGLAVVSALGLLFTSLLASVLDGEGVVYLDRPVSRWLAANREAGMTAVLRAVTALGSAPVLAVLAAVVCAVVVWRSRSWVPVVVGLLGGAGIGLVILLTKTLVARTRPARSFAVLVEQGYSFPSGHAAGTAAVALLSAWLVTHWVVRTWARRVAIWTGALLLIGAVGFSRIYLGVHYLSDVLAGWVLGALWAGVLVLAGTWWQEAHRPRAARRAGPMATPGVGSGCPDGREVPAGRAGGSASAASAHARSSRGRRGRRRPTAAQRRLEPRTFGIRRAAERSRPARGAGG